MSGIHLLDFVVIAAYLGLILYMAKRSAHTTHSQEGFFLAGRKLGKLYQFFLNFGNATDANGAVSTATLVYQQGASGVWLAFQTIFMNPYYWFMNMWFRRVRLVTVAELFEERLSSHNLAKIYALYQVAYVILFIGWGNLVGYSVTASLLPKPESAWTVQERHQVEAYHQYRELQQLEKTTALNKAQREELARLDDLYQNRQLHSYVAYIKPWMFYLGFTLIVGLYLWVGGMTGTARNEILQGLLILMFSVLLIPFGFSALGGVAPLRAHVPREMLELLGAPGTEAVSWYALLAILLVSIIQINGIIGNMGVSGSARNEYAARFGAVSGTYAKRLMIMMWTFVGLIGLGLYFGDKRLADPDLLWGQLSRHLLGPGVFGLMLAGLLAAMMSNIATNSMAASALLVRNVYAYLAPGRTDQHGVKVGRYAIAVILVLGMVVAVGMHDIVAFIRLQLTVNVPWGAAIVLMFFWRKLSRAAVWWCVGLSTLVFVAAPYFIQYVPALNQAPSLIAMTQPTTAGVRPVAMYYDKVLHTNPDDIRSPLIGTGRFNLEAWVLSKVGLNLEHMTFRDLQSVQFFFDGFFPFLVLIVVSLLTHPPGHEKVDWFFGKMKTPVGATPELEAAAMEETRRSPHRFDNTKLFPRSSWEWTKWDKVDTVGFIACLGVSGSIITLFWYLLRLTAGA